MNSAGSKKVQANLAKKVVDFMLKKDANSASCVIYHQPKAPETLARFKDSKSASEK